MEHQEAVDLDTTVMVNAPILVALGRHRGVMAVKAVIAVMFRIRKQAVEAAATINQAKMDQMLTGLGTEVMDTVQT